MAMTPLITPYFQWQSMLMPVLPLSLDAFLDAPVRRLSRDAARPRGATCGKSLHRLLVPFDDSR
jgi:hypothetical protein